MWSCDSQTTTTRPVASPTLGMFRVVRGGDFFHIIQHKTKTETDLDEEWN